MSKLAPTVAVLSAAPILCAVVARADTLTYDSLTTEMPFGSLSPCRREAPSKLKG
jgi:hypothetical protein